jgi:exodeoxyribonuclease V alpha subunit
VGDDAQLPSVSPGQVFKDLLATDLKRTHLTTIHRQAAGSKIIQMAQMIRENHVDLHAFDATGDLLLKPLKEPAFFDALSRMIQYYLDAGFSLSDVSVIIPVYAGKHGIDAVNTYIQTHFNHAPLKTLKNRAFKAGDKVLQLVNDYDHDVMNGDQGIIQTIERDHLVVQFDEKTVAYDGAKLDELRLAYAMSVHKSQGSGYPVVIMPIFRSFQHMLTQPLIYTALTRAIDACVITGDLVLFERAATIAPAPRNTQLTVKMTDAPQQLTPYDFLDN